MRQGKEVTRNLQNTYHHCYAVPSKLTPKQHALDRGGYSRLVCTIVLLMSDFKALFMHYSCVNNL